MIYWFLRAKIKVKYFYILSLLQAYKFLMLFGIRVRDLGVSIIQLGYEKTENLLPRERK